jgi:hypothetical protein
MDEAARFGIKFNQNEITKPYLLTYTKNSILKKD